MTRVFGWDLGGANVKLARVDGGRVVNVAQVPCPIIPERSKFDVAVEAALPLISSPALHAVTMTGELSDVFYDRAEGVAYLVELMQKLRRERPDLKIIFISGYAEDAFRKHLAENEDFMFLQKPFDLKELAAAVKAALQG